MTRRRTQQDSRAQGDGAFRSLLVWPVVALWLIAGATVGGVACLWVWFLSEMPPVLKHGEVRVPVGAHVYAGVMVVGIMLGLVGCFALRPRLDQGAPWRSARLPNRPQEPSSRDQSNRES
jgi:hypothetical protein